MQNLEKVNIKFLTIQSSKIEGINNLIKGYVIFDFNIDPCRFKLLNSSFPQLAQ